LCGEVESQEGQDRKEVSRQQISAEGRQDQRGMQVKRIVVLIALVAFVVMSFSAGQAVTPKGPFKHNFAVASGASLGSDHKSSLAQVSPVFKLPVGAGYMVCIEPDRDSTAAWNADTFHIALMTAPEGSIAVKDSITSGYNRWNWVLVKDFVMAKTHKANTTCYQFYFPPLDSVINGTGAGSDIPSDSLHLYGHIAVSAGIGRFVLSMDDADSTADAACGWNVYLIDEVNK
jgi:hypothetical protein